MISKRFSTSKKASKFSKRVLGMESLENRELLSINPLGYDGSDVVQTNATFASDFGTEAATAGSAATIGTALASVDNKITFTFTGTATDTYQVQYSVGSATGDTWVNATGTGASGTIADANPISVEIGGLSGYVGQTVHVRVLTAAAGDPISGEADTDKDTPANLTASAMGTGIAVVGSTSTPGAEGKIEVKGGTVVTGLTTSAATVTLPKVKNAKTFTLYVDGTKYYEGTKNQTVMTGLEAGDVYELKATFQDKDGKYLNLDGTAATNQTAPGDLIDLGKFTTFGEGDAAQATNPAINGSVAATYTLAGKGKEPNGTAIATDSIKVTWKAPANYTGAYTIVIENLADNTSTTKTIPAGSKTEAYVKSTDPDGSGTLTITKDAYYSIQVIAGNDDAANAVNSPAVIVATGANKIENYDVVDLGIPADPGGAAASAPAAAAGSGYSIKATVTPNASPGTAVGYWVALYESANVPSDGAAFDPTDTNIVALAYVTVPATGDPAVEFGGLTDTTKTYKAAAWAVNANGETSGAKADGGAGASPLYPTSQTADPSSAFTKAYAGSATAKAVSGTATSTKVEWKNTKADDDVNVILGWQVSYSADGGKNWILASTTAAGTLEYTFTGLNQVGVVYQFKVQAIVQETATAGAAGLDKDGVIVKNTKANVSKLDKVKKVELDTASATGIKAKWDAVSGASGYIVTVMDGKGIVWQGAVSGTTFDTDATAGLALVPGLKYDINVDAVQYNGDVVNAGKAKGSFSTLKFSEATLKVKSGEKAGMTSVNLDLTDKVTAPTGTTRAYIVEYTYVADAKGKADWSAASKVTVTGTAAALTGLKAGTQYYARVVAYNSDNSGTFDSTDITMIGKEFKFKTVAAPLPTISKSGYTLDGTDLGFTLTGKFVDDKNGLLQTGTKIYYQLIVSSDAVVDKATGKLANGVEIGTAAELIAYTDAEVAANSKLKGLYNNIDATLTGTGGVFDKLNAGSLNTANFKQLNFQLLVYYTTTDAATGVYATAYTKVAKLALPKWFA